MNNECEPNGSFYRRIDREYARDQAEKRVELQFKELCLQNDYKAVYFVESRRDKYQCTMKLTTVDDMTTYHLSSEICNSEAESMLNVKHKIVNIAETVRGGPTKRPPFQDSGLDFTPLKVDKFLR
jgi:hypothetical protein